MNNPEQLALDLEDANTRLARLARAQEEEDRLRELIREAESKLRQLRRRLKELLWDKSTLLRANQIKEGGKS